MTYVGCGLGPLTFAVRLHPGGRVDGITEETVPRHLESNDSCTHVACGTNDTRQEITATRTLTDHGDVQEVTRST